MDYQTLEGKIVKYTASGFEDEPVYLKVAHVDTEIGITLTYLDGSTAACLVHPEIHFKKHKIPWVYSDRTARNLQYTRDFENWVDAIIRETFDTQWEARSTRFSIEAGGTGEPNSHFTKDEMCAFR